MPSIFTRSRTTSTPKPKSTTIPDEFGRVTSRSSISTPSSKKDKKKDKVAPRPSDSIEIQVTEGGFLPFCIPSDSEDRAKLRPYGYLSYKCEVILGVDEVSRLVDVVSLEMAERGFLTTPLLFSSQALDISRTRIQKLIDTFLATCPSETNRPGSPAEKAWLDEARFSGPHELAMVLRWALARIVHLVNGQESRGILSWELYLRWREDEAASLYPTAHFSAFLSALPQPIQRLLSSLMTLLSRLAANATSSGLTPPMLASLFGPLLFGLGSPSLPFHHTYGAYLRSSHAAEHLLLAYIRSQPPPLPSRLADWIRGYPTMLPAPNRLDKARPGAKLKKLNTVKRYVRLYSNDLVKTAASWDLGNSKEWNRVTSTQPGLKAGGPRYSDSYRKHMGLATSEYPETGLPPSPNASITSTSSIVDDNDGVDSLAPKEDQLRFRSLTDLKWGEFESLGFLASSNATEKRLEFDLNEGARNPVPEKRTTITWSDFSQTGFMRNDAPLSATLQFSAPLSQTISTWPSKQHEIHSKLKKAQKALPTFSWDTTPILGGEEAIEESFLDVWCDVLCGTGWARREERVWRDCSWALVEYKAVPQNRPNGPLPPDPRTATSLWLYEEFIPNEYKSELSHPKRKPLLPNLTLSFSSKQQQQSYNAHTIPGSGYIGSPNSAGQSGGLGQSLSSRLPSARELEFEGLLQREASTKIISLGHNLNVVGGAGGPGGPGGPGAGARESTLSVSELGHGNVSDIGHGHGHSSGGPYYAPSMQGTPNAHVSSSIAPAPVPVPALAQTPETSATAADVPHSADSPQRPTLKQQQQQQAFPGTPTTPTVSTLNPHSDPSQPPPVQSGTALQIPGFFTAVTMPRKSPARFLSRVGRIGGGGGGSGGGESSGGLVGGGEESGEKEKEKSKRNGKDRLKARHSILRKGGKGSEETSVDFETRTIFGTDDDGEDGDERSHQFEKGAVSGGGDGEKTPTQLKFTRAYGHARNISKDDAWVDILVAGSGNTTNSSGNTTSGSAAATSGTAIRPRRSSDPESAGLSHDPDRAREEIRQVLKGAGPRPAEFSDEETDNNSEGARKAGRVGESFLSSQDRQPSINEYAESEGATEEDEIDDEALYGRPEPFTDEMIRTGSQTDYFGAGASASVKGQASIPSTSTPSSMSPSSPSPSPHNGDGNNNNGRLSLPLPSSMPNISSSSLRNNNPTEIHHQKADAEREMTPPLFVPSSSIPHDSKIPRLRPVNLDIMTGSTGDDSKRTVVPSMAPTSSSSSSAVPDPSFDEYMDVPDIGDAESTIQDDDSSSNKLIDPETLLSNLVVNPTTPRYVHGAPLHNVVEEEEE